MFFQPIGFNIGSSWAENYWWNFILCIYWAGHCLSDLYKLCDKKILNDERYFFANLIIAERFWNEFAPVYSEQNQQIM